MKNKISYTERKKNSNINNLMVKGGNIMKPCEIVCFTEPKQTYEEAKQKSIEVVNG